MTPFVARRGLALALLILGLVSASCGGEEAPGEADRATPAPGRSGTKTVQDPARKVSFRLRGRRLTVSVAPASPRATKADLLGRRSDFFCGRADEYGPFGASARARARIPAAAMEATVTLDRDIWPNVGFCGVESDAGAEAFGFFLPEEELLRRTERRFRERGGRAAR